MRDNGEMLETNKENKSRNRGRKRKREGTERKGKETRVGRAVLRGRGSYRKEQ